MKYIELDKVKNAIMKLEKPCDDRQDFYIESTTELEALIDSLALEQESTLDKIRTKIENHCGLTKEDHCKYCSYCNSVMGVREILEIIDKYKESENEE